MDNSQNPKQSKKRKQFKSFTRFSGLGIQMGVTIYLGHFIGELLDEKFNNIDQLYAKTATLVAVFLSMYLIIKQAIKFNEKND